MKKWIKKAVFGLVEWAGKARRNGRLAGLGLARCSRGLVWLDILGMARYSRGLARLDGLGWARFSRGLVGLDNLGRARFSRGLAGLENLENPEIPEPLAELARLGWARKAGAFWLMGLVMMIGLAGCSGGDFLSEEALEAAHEKALEEGQEAALEAGLETGLDAGQEAAAEAQKIYRLCIEARKGNGAETRALSLDDKTLNATWKQGETVAVYGLTGEGDSAVETAEPVAILTAQTDGECTTLTGTFPADYTPQVGEKLRLKFNSQSYKEQAGTLDFIANNCDYATAEVAIKTFTSEIDPNTPNSAIYYVETSPAEFVNQQAIVRFSLRDKATGRALLTNSLKVTYGPETYHVTLDETASEIFVAIPPKTAKNMTLIALTDAGFYAYDKPSVTFEKGQYYTISVALEHLILPTPLIAATTQQIGWPIGTDSNVYFPSDNLPDGVHAVAMIAYISSKGHGLAIEINHHVPHKNYSQSVSLALADKPSIYFGSWRLPSAQDWVKMITGCAINADQTAYMDPAYSFPIRPIEGFYFKGHSLGFLQAYTNQTYWTSTQTNTDTYRTVTLDFSSFPYQASFAEQPGTNCNFALACLAF